MNRIIYLIALFSLILIVPSSIEANENITDDNQKIETKINVKNITTNYKSNEEFKIELEDKYENKLSNKSLKLNINNKNYSLLTDDNGSVKWKIKLDSGNYTAFVSFNGTEKYHEAYVESKILVHKLKTEILSENTTFNKKGNDLEFKLIDKNGNPLKNQTIFILINGIEYSRFTDNKGIVKIEINLNPKNYNIKSYYKDSKNYYNSSKNITLKILESSEKLNVNLIAYDIIQDYGDGNYFNLTLKDNNNKPLINETISIIINGISYKRTTNDQGIAKIRINLYSGIYEVKGIFENEYFNTSSVINKITVNPAKTDLICENLTFHYGDEDYFNTQLLNKNKPLNNEEIKFTINGVTYIRKTYNDGNAFLKINLNPGIYNIKSEYIGDKSIESSIISNVLTVLKQNSTMESKNLNLNRKGEYLEVFLKDAYGKSIQNQCIQIKINGVIYNKFTDLKGIARLKINLNPDEYDIEYNFDENNLYKSCSFLTKLKMHPEDYKLNSKLITENHNITQKGNKFKVNLKDVNNLNIKNETIGISVNGKTYYRTSDDEGNAYLTINLLERTYDISCFFHGSKSFNQSIYYGKLFVNFTPNLIYSFNITTVLELNSTNPEEKVKAPIGRMIKITTDDGDYYLWYLVNEAKNYIDVVDIQENILYFIPFKNPSKEILKFDLNTNIRSSGISLIAYSGHIEIKYFGKTDNKFNRFDAIFNCYNDSGAGYENLEIYLNNVKKASIEFTIYLKVEGTVKFIKELGDKFLIYPENVKTILKINKLKMERNERLSYNILNTKLNIDTNYWNKDVNYDSIQSYIITNSKVSDSDVDFYLKNLDKSDNFKKTINDYFLGALTSFWLSDKLAEELSSKYNVTYKRVDFDLILSGINYYGPYLSSISYNAPETYIGELENIKSFKFLHSILFSEIEKFSLELSGKESECALSDIITCILSGKAFSITDYDEYQVISILDNSSKLIYYKNQSHVTTIISQRNLESSKGAISLSLGYLYPNKMFLNFNKLKFEEIYNKLGSFLVELLSFRKKISYELLAGGIGIYASFKGLLVQPKLITFMVGTSEIMCGIRESMEYEDWRYFGVYPAWKGKTFQFISNYKMMP